MMSQRHKTEPPTRKHSRSSASSQKGLIAKEKTKKQPAKRRPALDNRFHRTDLTLSRETHPGAPRLCGAPLAATNAQGAIRKRRDAVTLGGHEAARLPGLATSVSSASP